MVGGGAGFGMKVRVIPRDSWNEAALWSEEGIRWETGRRSIRDRARGAGTVGKHG